MISGSAFLCLGVVCCCLISCEFVFKLVVLVGLLLLLFGFLVTLVGGSFLNGDNDDFLLFSTNFIIALSID